MAWEYTHKQNYCCTLIEIIGALEDIPHGSWDYKKSKEGNLVGILYGAISTCGFSDITDIEEFLEIGNPDMLHLKSKLTDMEADIYKWELENYKVKDKPEQPFMY